MKQNLKVVEGIIDVRAPHDAWPHLAVLGPTSSCYGEIGNILAQDLQRC